MRLKIPTPQKFARCILPVLTLALSACAWSIFGLSGAQATDLFSVTNVASDDHLNVRAEPSHTAPIVGSLKFNAVSIAATGETRKVGNATWVEIFIGETIGWVNSAYLQATLSDNAPSLFHEPLACGGTEPFWGLKVNGTNGDFDTLAEGKSAIEFISSRTAGGVPIIWALKGRTQPSQSPVFALLEETNQCSDGMSDLTYRYSIRIDIEDGPFYAGCCNPHPGQPAP